MKVHQIFVTILFATALPLLPGIFHSRDFVEEGGLLSYGPDLHYSFYRAAYYVDRVLKGADPASIPVEQPMKFELAVNLKQRKRSERQWRLKYSRWRIGL